MKTPPQNEITPTGTIDSLRNAIFQRVIENTKQIIENICTIDSKDELSKVLLRCFPGNKDRVFRNFFERHPTCWFDLIRKIHKHRKNDSSHGWHISPDGIEDIYSTFLVRWRAEDIGEKLRERLPESITNNETLIEYASKQHSILDYDGYTFAQLPRTQRKRAIRKLLNFWLIKNIDGCVYENIDLHFQRVFPEILRYIKEIFWIFIHLHHCKNLDQLTKELERMFDSWRWENRENAFRVIQAFHAWGDIEDTEERYENAQEEIDELPTMFSEIGLLIKDVYATQDEGVIKYFWKLMYNGNEYDISWRAKTTKSSLQKEWESDEYGNIDVMRDTVWISIIWDDNTPESDKIDIITKCACLMPNFWYILKDKGELSDAGISGTVRRLIEKEKHPVYTTKKRDDSTSDLFKNTSISGFMKFRKHVLWTEVQFLSRSSAEWKKEDDKKYKPRSAIRALMRWPDVATPKECFNLLNERVKPNTLKRLWFDDLNGMLREMIDDSFLLPYVSADGSTLLLTCKWKEESFRNKFPKMNPCIQDNPHYGRMLHYISTIGGADSSFSPSTHETSQKPLFPDQ